MVRKMGPLTSVLGMIPGFAGAPAAEHEGRRTRARPDPGDRPLDDPRGAAAPELIKGSRRLRIARGSGTNVQQVNRLVKQFGQMRKVMRQVGRGKMPDIGALMRGAR